MSTKIQESTHSINNASWDLHFISISNSGTMTVVFLCFASFRQLRCRIDYYLHSKNHSVLPTKNGSLNTKRKKKNSTNPPPCVFFYSPAGSILSTHFLQDAKFFNFSIYYLLSTSYFLLSINFGIPFSFPFSN